jgi:hypothetical protein
MEMMGRRSRWPPSRAQTLLPSALPARSQSAQSTQAIEQDLAVARGVGEGEHPLPDPLGLEDVAAPHAGGERLVDQPRDLAAVRPVVPLVHLADQARVGAHAVMTVQRVRTLHVLPPKFRRRGISTAMVSTLSTRTRRARECR